jgi:RNA polymerase sigma-70 factor (ECF subfamily)
MHDALPEATLVERARSGDRSAYDALVRRHFGAVYRMLHRLIGNAEDAEDLAQECFVRAHGALSWYRSEAPFEAWLRRIALHLARDHFRRRSLRSARQTEELEFVPDRPEQRPESEVGRRELSARLAAAIERLPERLRTPLVLRALEGLEYEDVGRATGVTPATARTQVMQARKRLLRALAPWLGQRKEGGAR